MGEIKKMIRKQIYVFLNSAFIAQKMHPLCAIKVYGTNAVSTILSIHFSVVL